MYTTTVGKTFLKEYNRRNDKDYSAREFFDKVLHPLFFGHSKYLFWAQNSPFVQMKSGQKVHTLTPSDRQVKLDSFHQKIEEGEKDASIAIGYPASEVKDFATTSGLVSDLTLVTDSEDVYCSWIGVALSLGVAGGYALLFDDPAITYATFEGWQVYRKFLEDPALEKLPGNKIITWNGQWLAFKFGKRYREDFDFNHFVTIKAIAKNDAKNSIEINTVNWSALFFSLSTQYPNTSQTAYVFAVGQTNKTVGFIPFQFKSGRKLIQIYQKLFGAENYQTNAADFEALFGKHIKRACELGNIGLQALEPRDLAKYFKADKQFKLTKPNLKRRGTESDEDYELRRGKLLEKDRGNIITFQTYKTWLIAMISKNKEELLDYTKEVALALVEYRKGARKRDRVNLIEEKLFGKRSKSDFLESLIQIVQDDDVGNDIIEKIKELRDRVFLMNREDFSYLWLLLKFDYAYQERQVAE